MQRLYLRISQKVLLERFLKIFLIKNTVSKKIKDKFFIRILILRQFN